MQNHLERYRSSFIDWMACAIGGAGEPAAVAARAAASSLADRVLAVATAGHVLDFDDTYGPGLVHLSAPTAPVAIVLGAELGAGMEDVLAAYADGFEAMAALARASHPHLYEGGWHPTAVTGVVGAATAAARLLGLGEDRRHAAQRLALLGAGGLRAAFGSDGKALQVGMAAAQGVVAARLVAAGAHVPPGVVDGRDGFEQVFGGRWAEPTEELAVSANWIKAYPCCLQTHGPIEAARQVAGDGASSGGRGLVIVHPRARQAAPLDEVETGLQAKFSIPYTVAFTVLHGPPGVDDFASVDRDARRLASRVEVRIDDSLLESEAIIEWHEQNDVLEARVEAARGSPQRPMDKRALTQKVRSLSGSDLEAILDDPHQPAADVLEAVGLSW